MLRPFSRVRSGFPPRVFRSKCCADGFLFCLQLLFSGTLGFPLSYATRPPFALRLVRLVTVPQVDASAPFVSLAVVRLELRIVHFVRRLGTIVDDCVII